MICSPSFWVYYDLAVHADERVAEFKKKLYDYQLTSLIVGLSRKEFKPGLRESSLGSLIDSTFDPGLLEWDRKMAEVILSNHRKLFTEWSKEITYYRRLDEIRKFYKTPPRIVRVFKPIPHNLALVPMGFWVQSGKFASRPLDIPSAGRPSS